MATLSSKTGLPSFASSATGAGRINYFSNSGFEIDATTGVSTYADTPGVAPVDGTGGSPLITTAHITASPLDGVGSLEITKPDSNRQGDGVAFACTVPLGYVQGRKCEYTLLIDTNVTNYVAGDFVLYIYDVTNSTLITPSTTAVPKMTGPWTVSWDSSATGSSYRAIIHCAATHANAFTVKVDDVVVGPGTITQGAAVSAPASVTFTGSWVSNTTYTAFETRIGSWAKYEVRVVTTGAPTATGLTLTMPTGRTIDTTAMVNTANSSANILPNSSVGILDSGTEVYAGALSYTSSTSVRVMYLADTVAGVAYGAVTQAVPFTFANNDTITISFMVPIAEWAGSGTVNLGAGAQVTYWSDDGSGDVFGPNGSLVPNQAFASSSTSRTIAIPAKMLGQLLSLEINYRGNGWSHAGDIWPFVSGNNSTSSNIYGVQGVFVSSTSFQVTFGNRGTSVSASNVNDGASSWATEFAAGTRFRVVEANPSSAVGFGMATQTDSGLISNYVTTTKTTALAGATDAPTITIRQVRVGKLVTLTVERIPVTAGEVTKSGNGYLSFAMDSHFYPSSQTWFNNWGVIGTGTSTAVLWEITTGGEIRMYNNVAGATIANGVVCGWNNSLTFSYVLN